MARMFKHFRPAGDLKVADRFVISAERGQGVWVFGLT